MQSMRDYWSTFTLFTWVWLCLIYPYESLMVSGTVPLPQKKFCGTCIHISTTRQGNMRHWTTSVFVAKSLCWQFKLLLHMCICFRQCFDSLAWPAHNLLHSPHMVPFWGPSQNCGNEHRLNKTRVCDCIWNLQQCSAVLRGLSILVKHSDLQTTSMVLPPVHTTGSRHCLKLRGCWMNWPQHSQNFKKKIRPIRTQRPQTNRLSAHVLVEKISSSGYL